MSRQVFLDTNIVIWVVTNHYKKLSPLAKKTIASQSLVYSPMVRLEIEYLHESGKVKYPAGDFFKQLHKAVAISESTTSFFDICTKACTIGWTRETFDRLIVAEAMAHNAILVTADQNILKHYKRAVW